MAVTNPKLIKKHLIKPFLNGGTVQVPSWTQIKKATEFSRSMNPVTEERDYISDEHPTTEVMDYKPSEGLTITMYKGEEDFELLYRLYKERAIGADAQRELLIVYLFDSVEADDTIYYYAEKTNASITVDELNSSGSTLTATVYENGTATRGYVTIVDGSPEFTAGEMPTV